MINTADILETINIITKKLENYSPTFAVTASFGIYEIDSKRTSDSLMDIMNCTLLAQKAIKNPSARVLPPIQSGRNEGLPWAANKQ